MRNPFARVAKSEAPRPSLRERAAALKATASRVLRRAPSGEADQSRRAMVAGTLAAALPFPTLAGAAAHSDAGLLEAGARYDRAIIADVAAAAEYDLAWAPVREALKGCPPELIVSSADRYMILGGWRWPTALGGMLLAIPSDDGCGREAWSPHVLRSAISHAVPLLGKGGQTPHHIRRWRGLLPASEKLFSEYRAACAASDYIAKRKAHFDAQKELMDAAWGLRDFTASTPDGLAVLVRLADLDASRGCKFSDRFLPSVAAVVGVDLETVRRPRDGVFN